MTEVTFYLYDSEDQTKNTPVAGAQVRLYSEDGTTFVTYATTDASGNATLDVPDATYWVRAFKTGFSFDSKLSVVVDSALTNIFDIEAVNLVALRPSTDPNLCRANGYAVDAAGQPRSGATYKFMLIDWRHIVGDRAITSAGVYARSDKDGYIEVELIQGAFYEVTVEGTDDKTFVTLVPEAQAANITELIWPYPARIDLSDTAVSLLVGETQDVTAFLVLSSGTVLPAPADSPVSYGGLGYSASSSDTSVATIKNTEGTLTIEAVSPGTATISFSPTGSFQQRFPPVEVSLEEITVTVS